MLTCLASILLVAHVQPFPTPRENYWEIVNEIQVTVTLYFLFGVTDIIADPDVKQQIGWAMISCTSCTLSICLIRVGLRSFVEFYRILRTKFVEYITKTREKDNKAKKPPKKHF